MYGEIDLKGLLLNISTATRFVESQLKLNGLSPV